jgi:hypothetical protein
MAPLNKSFELTDTSKKKFPKLQYVTSASYDPAEAGDCNREYLA